MKKNQNSKSVLGKGMKSFRKESVLIFCQTLGKGVFFLVYPTASWEATVQKITILMIKNVLELVFTSFRVGTF
jgi:hypothetical protein